MTTDYNEKGIKYIEYVQNIGTAPSGYLNPRGVSWLLSLRKALAQQASSSLDAEEKQFLAQLGGCLHHLSAFLFQVERIVEHIDALKRIPSLTVNPAYPVSITKVGTAAEPNIESLLSAPAMIQICIASLEYDFLQLLLTGVATLERAATFVSTVLLGREVKFFNLKNELAKSSDLRAKEITTAIASIYPKIKHILVSDPSTKSLRNRIAHLQSIPELTNRSMIFFLLPGDRILRFDGELAGFPILKTAHQISGALPHLIAAICRTMFTKDATGIEIKKHAEFGTLDERWFDPEWVNPTVHFNEFIDPSNEGPLVSFSKPLLHGIELSSAHLRPEVFKYAEPFQLPKE